MMSATDLQMVQQKNCIYVYTGSEKETANKEKC